MRAAPPVFPPSRPPAAPRSAPSPSLTVLLYRYFFYRWLFRDATRGSLFERAAALHHNREQVRWLPLYMARWTVLAAVLALAQFGAEQLLGTTPLAAALAIAVILATLFLLLTALCWAMLRWRGVQ